MNADDQTDAAAVAGAMAVYSADGQADDATGGDAGAETLASSRGRGRERDGDDTDEMPHGPS